MLEAEWALLRGLTQGLSDRCSQLGAGAGQLENFLTHISGDNGQLPAEDFPELWLKYLSGVRPCHLGLIILCQLGSKGTSQESKAETCGIVRT